MTTTNREMDQCENCNNFFSHAPLFGGRSGKRGFCCEDCKREMEFLERLTVDQEDVLDHDFSMNG